MRKTYTEAINAVAQMMYNKLSEQNYSEYIALKEHASTLLSMLYIVNEDKVSEDLGTLCQIIQISESKKK